MKPERIQRELRVPGAASEAVTDFLDDQPGWRLGAGGSRLVRHYDFTSPRAAAAFTRFAAEVAADLEQVCTLELRGAELRLVVGAADVLGERDVELAEALSRAD